MRTFPSKEYYDSSLIVVRRLDALRTGLIQVRRTYCQNYSYAELSFCPTAASRS